MLGLLTLESATATDEGRIMCIMDEEEIIEGDNNNLYTTPITLPKNCTRDNAADNNTLRHLPIAFQLQNALTPDECNNLLLQASSTARSTGFHYVKEAKHSADDGSEYTIELMKPNTHKLSLFRNDAFCTVLWQSISDAVVQYLPEEFVARYGLPVGLNPRLRVLRYDAVDNDVFDPHFDVTTFANGDDKGEPACININTRQSCQSSLLTVLVYLNQGFVGGETMFLDYSNVANNPRSVVPVTGSIAVFEHGLYHSGSPLMDGTKYILRTDILFESICRSASSSQSKNKNKNGVSARTVDDCERAIYRLHQCRCQRQHRHLP